MEPFTAIGSVGNVIRLVCYASTLSLRIGELSSAARKHPSKIETLVERLALTLRTLKDLDEVFLLLLDQE